MNFLSISVFMPIAVGQTTLEIGRGAYGADQLLYIGACGKKIRLDPSAANDFLRGLRDMALNVNTGWQGSATFFSGCIEDPEGAVLSVCLEIESGRSWLVLDDYRAELRPEHVEFLNESCKQGWPLANGGRRGMSMGALLARRYKEGQRRQDLRQQNHPQRTQVEGWLDYIEAKHRREFG